MIKKSIINDILKKGYSLNEIERHLVHAYLLQNDLDFSASTLLNEYFSGFELNTGLFIEVSSIQLSNLKILENYLELLIPDNDKKLNGAFFTPVFIVDFIISELTPKDKDRNLDPSCGCGAFLIGLAEYYKKQFGKTIKQTINENIFGSDILEYNIQRSKLLLAILGLHHQEIVEEDDFNLLIVDSLRYDWKEKYDNIVGNPPYVKYQDLSEENRNLLIKNWKTIETGTFNLYFAFFELGLNLLTDNGKLGYITPNNYFTSLSGEPLRKFFQHTKSISRIVDFNHKKVFDAQTYTAITFLSKECSDAIVYDRIEHNQTPESFIKRVNGSPNQLNQLNPRKWRLLKTDEQKNIKTIENIGVPIGQLFNIVVGIATLKDELYFIDCKNLSDGFYLKYTDYGTFRIEKEITKPVYKISDFKSQEEVDNNSRRIICPYELKNGTAIPISEERFKNSFPGCYEYLCAVKQDLMQRDKGKIVYNPFYVWGRTQGITKMGIKLISPTFSQFPRFLIAKEEDSYFTNGYGIFFKNTSDPILFTSSINPLSQVENIDVVQKILNSAVMHYYVSKTSVSIEGGYPCYQKNFIEKFSIPELTNDEICTLRMLSNPNEINEFLSEKYQLNLLAPNLRS